jgi:hypothetical protein
MFSARPAFGRESKRAARRLDCQIPFGDNGTSSWP